MEVSDSELKAFEEAYETDFGESITADDAREMLTRLVLLYERIAQELPKKPSGTHE